MIFDTRAQREREWRNGLKARSLIGEMGLASAEALALSEARAAGFRWRRRAHWQRVLRHIRAEAKRVEGNMERVAIPN